MFSKDIVYLRQMSVLDDGICNRFSNKHIRKPLLILLVF